MNDDGGRSRSTRRKYDAQVLIEQGKMKPSGLTLFEENNRICILISTEMRNVAQPLVTHRLLGIQPVKSAVRRPGFGSDPEE